MSAIKCPVKTCGQDIDADSLYCDQCGAQIFICSVCKRPGTGKRCTFDGKEMILPAGEAMPQTSSASTTTLSPSAAPSSAPPSASAASAAAAGDKVKLSSPGSGINIEAKADDVLGRTKGNFASVLGRFSHISGSHCRILLTNGAWNLMDLGSTNGTFYNGAKLAPNVPVVLQNNGKIKLADIEFTVSFDVAEEGTQRI